MIRAIYNHCLTTSHFGAIILMTWIFINKNKFLKQRNDKQFSHTWTHRNLSQVNVNIIPSLQQPKRFYTLLLSLDSQHAGANYPKCRCKLPDMQVQTTRHAGANYKTCKLSELQTTGVTNYQSCKLPELKTVRVANCQSWKLLSCKLAELQTTRVAYYQSCKLPELQTTAWVANYQSCKLPKLQTTRVLNYQSWTASRHCLAMKVTRCIKDTCFYLSLSN